MKMKKNYGFARLVRVITPAKGRVEAKCPVARACGGCQLQELDYKEQLKFKEKKVYNHLKRIGGMENLFLPEEAEQAAGVPDAVVMEPIIGMEDPWRYRNKAQYPIGRGKDGKSTAGFFVAFTRAKQRVIFTYCPTRGNRNAIQPLYALLQQAGVSTISQP